MNIKLKRNNLGVWYNVPFLHFYDAFSLTLCVHFAAKKPHSSMWLFSGEVNASRETLQVSKNPKNGTRAPSCTVFWICRALKQLAP